MSDPQMKPAVHPEEPPVSSSSSSYFPSRRSTEPQLHTAHEADKAHRRRSSRSLLMPANSSSGTTYGPSHDVDSTKSLSYRSSLEQDVCYSPHNRRATANGDPAVDYEALSEYLRTGEIFGKTALKKVDAKTTSERHLTRRDSKGFTGGKPLASDAHRFMFYSKNSGVLRADRFTDLYAPESQSAEEDSEEFNEGKGGRSSPPAHLHKSAEDIIKAGNFWLDVSKPTELEMKAFSRIFGIHPLTVEDILMEEDREKCEIFPNYNFVCFRTFDQDQYSVSYLQPIVYYLVVMREGILSFHFQTTPHAHNVLKRTQQLKDYIPVTADWLCYALIDDITDSFAPLIRQLEAEVVSIDELVLILRESEQSDMLQRIGHARRNVMGLLRLLNAKPDVIKALSKRVPTSSDIGLYYGDIQDHVLSMLSSLNHYEGVLGRSHSNYLAQISIEITQSANQTNAVLTKITILGSILVPMNVITGLWGMNVPVPGKDDEGRDLNWFLGICAFLVLFSVGCILYLKRTLAI